MPRASCPSAGPTTPTRPIPDIELEIGLVMRSPRAILTEPGDDGVLHLAPAALDGRPGTRAPHVALADGRSTLDHLGAGFAVLRAAGRRRRRLGSAGRRVPRHRCDGFAAAYGLEPGGATLVRPDGVSRGARAARPTGRRSPGRSRRRLARSPQGATAAAAGG
jgi:hypothetical protein